MVKHFIKLFQFFYTAPGPVRTLQTSRGSTKIKVSWTPPEIIGETAVIGYLVEYKTAGAESKWVKVKQDLITKTSCTISGLKAGCEYQVRVSAVNEGGHGPQSESEIVATTGE